MNTMKKKQTNRYLLVGFILLNILANAQDSSLVEGAPNIPAFKNIISVEGSGTVYRVPYKGYFYNQITDEGELYNISSSGMNVNYYKRFKKNKNWMWGVSMGYEWVWVRFYDVAAPYNTDSHDTLYNIQKYNNTLLPFKYNIIDGCDVDNRYVQQKAMLKYFGIRTFYWEYIKMGYSLKYQKAWSKNFSFLFTIQSVGYAARGPIRRLDKLNNYIDFDYASGTSEGYVDFGGAELIGITPLGPLSYIFETIKYYKNENNKVPNEQIVYFISGKYNFLKRHTLVFNLKVSNLFNYRIPKINEYRLYNNTMGMGGPITSAPWQRGFFYIPIYPQMYQQLSFSIEYGIEF